jgi:hypothetical protein
MDGGGLSEVGYWTAYKDAGCFVANNRNIGAVFMSKIILKA